MKRTLRVFVMLLLFASLFVPLASPQATEDAVDAQEAPWWDDDQKIGVDRFREGWNLRIPLELSDAQGHIEGAPVQVHLDLAQSLIEGGWPEQNGRPTSFMAYPEAVRLVEYDDWDQIKGEVPFRQHTTWLEPNQRDTQYNKLQTGPFHGQRNPVVTLEWRLTQDLDADEAHRFMVYFDIENNAGPEKKHRKTSPDFNARDVERLDSLYWVGAGTTVYGYHEQQSEAQDNLLILATKDNTNVAISVYGTSIRASLDDRPTSTPEFTLTQAGDARSHSFGFQRDTPFFIEADKPIVVMSHNLDEDGTTPMPDFVPSRQGGLLGWDFDVPEAATGVYVIRPPGGQETPSRVSVNPTGVTARGCETEQGGSVVVLRNLMDSRSGQDQKPRLSFCRITFDNPMRDNIRSFSVQSGDPVMIQFLPSVLGSNHPVQVPSALGAPVGATFHASTLSGQECQDSSPQGGFEVTAWENNLVDVVDRDQSFPPFRHEREPVAGGDWRLMHGENLPLTECPSGRDTSPHSVEAVDEDGEPAGPIQVRAGKFDATAIQDNPFGGRHGMEFMLQGPFLVHSYYPDTGVEVIHEDGSIDTATFSLAGHPRAFDIAITERSTLQADKPVSVFPLQQPGGGFSRFHAAKPDFLEPDILAGQYRGYLIDARSADGTDPVFRTGLPGEQLTVPFVVRNLGQWDGPLEDTVRFSVEVDSQNWDGAATVGATLDDSSLLLLDDQAQNNRLTLDLPSDIPSETQLTATLHAQSKGNAQMTQSFSIVVLVRQTFDVEMWFGEPTSPSGLQVKEVGIEEDTQEAIPFVIQNKGSNIDSFDLDVSNPGAGWDARLTDVVGQPLSRVEGLDPGDQVGGLLHVRSPATPEIPSVTIPISAVSTTSPLASDLITLVADIAFEQDMQLQADERIQSIAPGQTKRFDVTLRNTGEAGLSVRMGLEATLPPGWSIDFAGLGHPEDPPVSLGPGEHVIIPLDVTAAEDSGADDFVSFLLRAEAEGVGVDARAAISLAARVDRSHLLEVSPLQGLVLVPGEATMFEITVKNLGNSADTVSVEPLQIPGGWNLTGGNVTHELPVGETLTITLNLTLPEQEPPGSIALLLQARSGGPAFAFPVLGEVATVHKLAWHDMSPLLVQPGETKQADLRLENQGNVVERVTLEASGPAGWTQRLLTGTLEVPPGSSRMVALEWDVPAGQSDANASLVVTARTESGITKETTVSVRVEGARLDLDDLVLTAAPRGPGSVGTVIAMLENPGEVPVIGAEARLLGEDEDGARVVVDRVRFESVGANGSVVAPLRWVEGEHARVDEIVWGKTQDGVFLEMGAQALPEQEREDPGERAALPLAPVMSLVLVVIGVVWVKRHHGKGETFE